MVAPTSFFADYGCHVRILEEARALRRLGQQVAIVTYFNGRDVDGLDIRRTLPIPWRRDYEVGSSRHKLGFDVLLGVAALRAGLGFRPDVVHGHLHEGALIGGAVARALRRPLVFDYQGSLSAEMVDHGFLDAAGPLFRPVRALERRLDRLAGAVVTSSHHAARRLVADAGLDARRVHTLSDCVDVHAFRPDRLGGERRDAARAALGIPPDRRVVAYLGLLARHQGTDLLLEAARRVVDARPDVHFLVMGFPGVGEYLAQAAALGLDGHVTFTGRVPYEDAADRLALGDVAVSTKLSKTEGSGKLLNYMASALPTVAFDTPASREYLGADGAYAPVGDTGAFAAALLALLADPVGAAAMGRRLRARAEAEYDWDHAGERLLEVYDRLIAQRRGAGVPAARGPIERLGG
jgi:glycosyltransferase involved in cell wall biosynthesis